MINSEQAVRDLAFKPKRQQAARKSTRNEARRTLFFSSCSECCRWSRIAAQRHEANRRCFRLLQATGREEATDGVSYPDQALSCALVAQVGGCTRHKQRELHHTKPAHTCSESNLRSAVWWWMSRPDRRTFSARFCAQPCTESGKSHRNNRWQHEAATGYSKRWTRLACSTSELNWCCDICTFSLASAAYEQRARQLRPERNTSQGSLNGLAKKQDTQKSMPEQQHPPAPPARQRVRDTRARTRTLAARHRLQRQRQQQSLPCRRHRRRPDPDPHRPRRQMLKQENHI